MRAREFIREFGDDETVGGDDSIGDDTTGANDNVDSFASLLTVLQFLKARNKQLGGYTKMKTASLINMVKNAGDQSFSYADLVTAQSASPAVKNLIKDMNQDEVILSSESDDDQNAEIEGGPHKNPEDVVSGMADKALNKRQ